MARANRAAADLAAAQAVRLENIRRKLAENERMARRERFRRMTAPLERELARREQERENG